MKRKSSKCGRYSILSRRRVLGGLFGGLFGTSLLKADEEAQRQRRVERLAEGIKAHQEALHVGLISIGEARLMENVPPKPDGDYALLCCNGVMQWFPITKCE